MDTMTERTTVVTPLYGFSVRHNETDTDTRAIGLVQGVGVQFIRFFLVSQRNHFKIIALTKPLLNCQL